MGIVRGAFRGATKVSRGTYRATKSTYRAGKSISRGRVPSVSAGVGALGFGVRVGTRGIRLKSPIAGVSLGSSGFRTTVGVPGIAHVSVRPLKPSAVVGLGPLRAHLARHPGVSIRAGLVGMGMTTSPMFWSQIGSYRVAIPGSFSSGYQRWFEEIDNQWRPHYSRRPPSFLSDLHDVIYQTEIAPLEDPFRSIKKIQRPQPSASELTVSELQEIKVATRKEAFKDFRFWNIHKIFETYQNAQSLFLHECSEVAKERKEEARERARIINLAYDRWQKGDLAAQSFVVGASLAIVEPSAFIVDINNQCVTVLVVVSDVDDIHPEKPTFTPSGQKSVKKKTKSERQRTHTDLLFAKAMNAVNVVVQRAINVQQIRIVVAIQDNSVTGIENFRVGIDFKGEASVLKALVGTSVAKNQRYSNLYFFQNSLLTPQPRLSAVLPQHLIRARKDAPAVAYRVNDLNDLSSEGFWLEIAAAIDALPVIGENIGLGGSTNQASVKVQPSSAPISRPVSGRPIIDMSNIEPPRDIQRPQIAMKRAVIVEREEKYLMGIVDEAKNAVRSANKEAVLQVTKNLLTRLPKVPVGADDEAELVFLELIDALIVLIDTSLMNDLQIAVSASNQSVRNRFFPLLSDLVSMVSIRNSIVNYVKNDSKAIESELSILLQLDELDVRRVCWYLDHFDVLVRTKAGNSYRLEIAE